MEHSLQRCLAELLRRADDHFPGLELAGADKALLRGKLLTILVDREDFRVYLRELLSNARQVSSTGCRHNTPLPADRLEALLASGPSILTDPELAKLMLNPMALSIAQAALDARMSDGPDAPLADDWSTAEELAGQQAIARAGINLNLHRPTTLLENLKKSQSASDLEGVHDQEATVPPLTETRVPQRGVIPFPGRTTGRFRLHWFAAAVAAALIAGIFIGLWAQKSISPDGGKGFEVFLAEARPRPGVLRGGPESPKAIWGKDNAYRFKSDGDFVVEIRSPRKGFATIVLFSEDGPPEVFPATGQPDLQVEPFVTLPSPALPLTGRTTVVILVTPTPAADLARQVLGGAAVPLGERNHKIGEIKAALQDKGYAWMATDEVVVEPLKAP